MRGTRLIVAQGKAEKIFKRYKGFSPRNEDQLGSYYGSWWTDDDIKRMVGIYRKTKVPCSCYICGNPRRHWGYLPMQEVKQHLNADFQYEDICWNYRKLRWLKGWLD